MNSRNRWISLSIIVAIVGACEAGEYDPGDEASFRDGASSEMGPPAPDAPVVATLLPGAPFEIGDRYAFAKAPGVGPNMSRFAPTIVDQIPHLRSGDVVAVKRNGMTSRARILGLGENGRPQFLPQADSPFPLAFVPIPWSAWGSAGSSVAACSQAVANTWLPCVAEVGESGWCSDAADEELDDCASGQDYSVTATFGGLHHPEFECLLPAPFSRTVVDESMNIGGCEGTFSGVITQEPGFMGCEDVYDGIWVADDPDCMDGPADVIVLHQ